MFTALWLADYLHWCENDEKWRIKVTDGKLLNADINNVHAQLFAKLSPGGDANRLSGLTFSTRKLPQAWIAFIARPPTDEKIISSRHYCSNNLNDRRGH